MKSVFLFLAAVLLTLHVKAQQSFRDSLLQAFRNEKIETGKTKIITSLSMQRKDSIVRWIITSELKSAKTEDTMKVYLLCQMINILAARDADSALLLTQQALSISERLKFTRGEANSLRLMGFLFKNNGNYPKAIELTLAALKKMEELKDEKRTGWVYRDLATSYASMGDYTMSTSYTLKAKAIAEKFQDSSGILMCVINLGDDYEKSNKLDSARYYTQLGYQLSRSWQDQFNELITLGNFGNIYAKMDQPDIAIGYYRAALPSFIEEEDWTPGSEMSLGMAKAFEKKGMYDSVKFYAAIALNAARNSGVPENLLAINSFMADYYRKKGITDSAYVYLNAMLEAKDSLFSQEKNRQIQNLGFEESIRQEKIAELKKEQEEERQTNLQYAIIAIGVICFAVIFLLLSRTVIVNEKWIRFLGVLGLLLVFEFINLFLHPFIGNITHHSPVLMLLFMVVLAALLIPIHHRLEHWIKTKMTSKNKALRLAAARKTVARLEAETQLEEKGGH